MPQGIICFLLCQDSQKKYVHDIFCELCKWNKAILALKLGKWSILIGKTRNQIEENNEFPLVERGYIGHLINLNYGKIIHKQ